MSAAHRLAMAGMLLLGLALVGVTVVVVDMVYGRDAALTGGGIAAAAFVALWLVLPLLVRASRRADAPAVASLLARSTERRAGTERPAGGSRRAGELYGCQGCDLRLAT